MAQVSGNKINVVPASKNLGTIIDTQVSGEKVNAELACRKITDVEKTQLEGKRKLTNYIGTNAEGIDIFNNKKSLEEGEDEESRIHDAFYIIGVAFMEANYKISEQEADKKLKNRPGSEFSQPDR